MNTHTNQTVLCSSNSANQTLQRASNCPSSPSSRDNSQQQSGIENPKPLTAAERHRIAEQKRRNEETAAYKELVKQIRGNLGDTQATVLVKAQIYLQDIIDKNKALRSMYLGQNSDLPPPPPQLVDPREVEGPSLDPALGGTGTTLQPSMEEPSLAELEATLATAVVRLSSFP